jgi:hypothetical protein
MGREADALEDVRGVRASTWAMPEAIARAALAEAIVLAKKDDREALARSLRANARLVEHLPPRERTLFRAFRRMVEVRAGNVYREPSRPTDAAREEPLLGEWVSKIVPQAAAFVPEAERQTESAPLSLSPAGPSAPAGSATISQSSRQPVPVARVLVLWGILIVMFLAIWQFLEPAAPPSHARPRVPAAAPAPDHGDVLLPIVMAGSILFVALVAGRVFLAVRRAHVNAARLRDAMRVLVSGDAAECARQLTTLTRERDDGIVASAQLQLAILAEKRHAMNEAFAHCDAGIARVSRQPYVRALHSDILVPELIAERAFLLAAIGRPAESEAELAALGRDHPTFAYMTRSVFRVRMVQALRASDLARATRLARERTPELPLSARDEMLADLVLALSGGRLVEGEVERLSTELAEDDALAAWIDFMAPGAREQLAARRART